ncbi:MAG TPA: peptidase M16 [Thiothrix sp.]|nr:peptidase M16 [Thiothrix sp.]
MTQTTTATPDSHPAFVWKRTEVIDSLNVSIEEYEHVKTGAVHYHLNTDNDENVFLVGLRTVPTDSTGVAHMLEHTALCGSKNYPVRDPFFMMTRRSLNTFMNAFTSSDWTAYPFASKNKKDFNNLLDVYLDAVFFSRLDKMDFLQEGWRIEFEEANNPKSDLVYKGVVFNEMKGAMSAPTSVLWQELTKHLFPTTTYHYNSGGEPENIPDLSYEELKAFYKTHYHPSNAVFMTYGNISAVEHQGRFEDQALSQFEKQDTFIEVDDEQRYSAPQTFEATYALDKAEQGDRTHIVMGWLLGRSIDTMEALRVNLMTAVLLDNSASPLRHALETTSLGSAPSPMCGTEDSNREMTFMAGIEGTKPENADALQALIIGVLEDVAKNGVAQDKIDAVLHQLELNQREVGGSGYPFGLQLILGGLSTAMHRGDVMATLNLDAVLEQLREEASQPNFIQNMIQKNLLDNPHRIRLVLKPDVTLAEQKENKEKARLAAIKAAMNDADKQQVIDLAVQLEKRQLEVDDAEILPKVTKDDVPVDIHVASSTQDKVGEADLTCFAQGTNGLVYQKIVADIPELDDDSLTIMPQYLSCLTELGVGEKSYMETQGWQDAVSGGVSVSTMIRADKDDAHSVRGKYIMSGKALVRNHGELTNLLQHTLNEAHFDEHARIRELISQSRIRSEHSVTGSGHVLAMQAAASGMSANAKLSHRLYGLEGIRRIKALDDRLDDEKQLAAVAEQMQDLHQQLSQGKKEFVLVAEAEQLPSLKNDLVQYWGKDNVNNIGSCFSLDKITKQVNQCWMTNTQVNFCAKAYPAVSSAHKDAAALNVLAGFLRNSYLHTAIREQGGAYGGGAAFDSDNACFRFYSYRDPRFTETLDDFDKSLEWLQAHPHEYQPLEEAILGVISSIDKPSSPAGEASKAYFSALFGRDADYRRNYRARILAVTLEDLKRVGNDWLQPALASTAVVSHTGNQQQADKLGLEIFQL